MTRPKKCLHKIVEICIKMIVIMKRFITVITLVIQFNLGFGQFGFSGGDTSYLQIEIKGLHKSAFLSANQYNSFLFTNNKLDVLLKKDTTIVIPSILYHATRFELGFNFENIASIMLLPKDTLKIYISIDSASKASIEYVGKTASISKYLTFSKFNYRSIPKNNQSTKEFNNQVDSLTSICLDSLSNYDNRTHLPNWFLTFEKTDIRFTNMFWKIIQFQCHYVYYKQRLARPDTFIDSLGFDINDSSTVLSEHYFDVSWMYLSSTKFDTLLTLLDDKNINNYRFDFRKEILQNAKKLKNKRLGNYIFLSVLSNTLTNKGFEAAIENFDDSYISNYNSLFDIVKDDFVDSSVYKVLIKLSESQMKLYTNSKKVAKKGLNNDNLKYDKILPDIYLSNFNGDSIKLSDFKGKYVFINFWATWCGACIASFPEKNSIIQKYSSRDLVFINICLEGEKSHWSKIVESKGLKGINLFCDSNKSKSMKILYKIKGYPQYALIDKFEKVLLENTYDLKEVENEIIKIR
jgi:thiol-disulfide isomerase/thioredoxin